jgi:hypothetical protein
LTSIIVGIAALTILVAYAEYVAAGPITHGFVGCYAAARLLVTGQFGPHVYDDGWFQRYIQDLTGSGVLEIFGPNPPTMALMAVPVVFLDLFAARHVWLLVSLGSLALAVAVLIRSHEAETAAVPAALVALILLNPAVFANLRTGQVYLFVFALLTATAISLLRGCEKLSGLFLGLALIFKSSGVALLVLLIARRRWRAVGVALSVCVAAVLLVAPAIDPRTWAAYPASIEQFVARPSSSVTAYQTTLSLFRHLCVGDPVWNPSPAANCAPIATVLPAVLLGAAVLMTIVLSARAPARLWLAAGVCLAELTLPVAAEQHFVSLAVPLVLLWPFKELGVYRMAFVLVVAALLLVPLDYTAHRLTTGWSALGAYPRLYAAWMLWGASVVAMRRTRATS